MKYLVYIGPGIGDLIIALPMLYSIKENDPEAYIKIFMASDKNRMSITYKMLELVSCVDKCSYYNVREPMHSIGFFLENFINKSDYGIVLQYTNTKDTSTWPYKIITQCSKRTIGMNLSKVKKPKYDHFVEFKTNHSIVDYSLEMVEKMGIKPLIKAGHYLNEPVLLERMKSFNSIFNKTNDIIVICPGTAKIGMKIDGVSYSSDNKSWPIENWIELCNILSLKGYQVVLLGGKKEAEEIQTSQSIDLSQEVTDLTGKTDILDSIAIINKSDLVIGCDTGLLHCAGALNKPSITLFGCTDWHEYLAYGEHSYYLTANESCSPCFGTSNAVFCKHRNCMRNLSVQMVLDKIEEVCKDTLVKNEN